MPTQHETLESADSQQAPIPPPLTIEERRQVVYSSLLRYASEAVPLRERALNRAVAGALLGSAESEPFRVGKIQENLRYRPDAPLVRIETVQETLRRLMAEDLVAQTELMKRHAYYLTTKGYEEVGKVVTTSEELFNAVLGAALRDTRHLVDQETGAAVFRKFVFQCFARFGQVIAKNVAGQIDHDTLLRNADVEAAFGAAVAGRGLSAEAVDSLRARCFAFLRSHEADAERLKFHLTQGYYVTQLLGLENGKFDPLNEHAFKNSVFYLDTNVLLCGIVYLDENSLLFGEMVSVAKRIGIELRVTRATMNEARRVAADRLSLLEEIAGVIPAELARRTDDQFIEGYLDARARIPGLTPKEFLEPFDRLADVVENQLRLVIDDRTEEEILAGRDFSRAAETMNAAAEETRGYGKSEIVLAHDVSHFAAVEDLRASGAKAWFLTRDKTLAETAARLAGDEPLFVFQLIGFLHTISPFLSTVSEEQPFADAFSDFLTENLFPVGNIFDAQELAIMAKFHADVMSTPAELLIQAFDYVKSKALEGRTYRRSDIPLVSLELRKFLSSSDERRFAALQAERERLAAESEEERRRRLAAEAARRRGDAEKDELRGRLDDTRHEVTETRSELADARTRLTEQEKSFAVREQRRRALYAALGLLGGVCIWIFGDAVLEVLGRKMTIPTELGGPALTLLNAAGAAAFSLPAFLYVRHTQWAHERKLAAYTMVVLTALAASRVLGGDAINSMASLIEVGMLIVGLAAAAFLVERKAEG